MGKEKLGINDELDGYFADDEGYGGNNSQKDKGRVSNKSNSKKSGNKEILMTRPVSNADNQDSNKNNSNQSGGEEIPIISTMPHRPNADTVINFEFSTDGR